MNQVAFPISTKAISQFQFLQQKGHIDIISRSGEHLLTLINDILEMSKIEAGHARLSPVDCDFDTLLTDIEAMFRVRAEEKGLLFEVNRIGPGPRYLHADSGKIKQVLMNMLANAVKFTKMGGITMRVGNLGGSPERLVDAAAGRTRVQVAIDVADTGCGIMLEEIGKVFEPFEQTQSGQHKGRGTGLGMPISRQYARMMGGDLTVESEVDKGSTFRFTFLAEAADTSKFEANIARQSKRVIGLKPGGPTPTVLVVDDNEANREMLRCLLETVGFEVREAVDGPEAVSLFEEWRPALVLMDRRMPGMDGLEATRAIKVSAGGRDARVVIVSASVLGSKEQDWFNVGADGFIPKPFKEEEIMAVIGELLGIEFVYEEPGAAVDSSAALLCLASDQVTAGLCAELIEATESGNFSRLLQLIEQRIMPENPSMGQKLRQLAKKFDYDAIVRILSRGDDHE